MAPPDISDKAIPESGNGLAFKPVSRSAKPKRRWGLIFSVTFVALIIGAAGAGYLVFEESLEEGEEFSVPLIRAKAGPIKTRPKNPGGMDVQHRDKLIYDRLPGGAERTPVEVLNPPPESPLPPPKKIESKVAPAPIVAPPVVKVPPPGPKIPTPKDVASIKTPVPAPMSPVVDGAKPKTEPKPEPKIVKRPPPPPPPPMVQPEPPKAPAIPVVKMLKKAPATPKPAPFVLKSLEDGKPKPLPAPKSVQASPVAKPVASANSSVSKGKGEIKIQLAAVRSIERATTEWSRLRRKHSDLLKGLSLTVTKADLGPVKGIYYRLRAGPVATESTAKSLCAQLTQRKIGCMVVRDK
jgi:hypothetical protein